MIQKGLENPPARKRKVSVSCGAINLTEGSPAWRLIPQLSPDKCSAGSAALPSSPAIISLTPFSHADQQPGTCTPREGSGVGALAVPAPPPFQNQSVPDPVTLLQQPSSSCGMLSLAGCFWAHGNLVSPFSVDADNSVEKFVTKKKLPNVMALSPAAPAEQV